MPRTIQLQNAVYDKLTSLMGPKESYSQVVERMLIMFDKLGELRNILEGDIKFEHWKREQLEKTAAPDG